MKKIILILGLLVSVTAFAAPQKVTAVYAATRDGKPFATVNETFRQEGSHYRIESVTSGSGIFALFGKRTLISEGDVTADGLKPSRFEQQQGDDGRKKIVAEFDWGAKKLTMTAKNKTTTVDLEPGTQDLASFSYQFMFQPPSGDEVTMQVTTGKSMRSYHYQVTKTNEKLDALGGLKVVRLAKPAKDQADNEKEFWLAAEKHYVPAKIVLRDESGARIEQVLTSLSIE